MRDARLNKMCGENIAALRACTGKSEAIRLYKRTIDWALERGYPTMDVLRKEFDNDDARDLGIYIDRIFYGEILDRHQVYVFHNCKGDINTQLNYDRRIIPMLYFANGCEMTVDCKQLQPCGIPIRVPLYIFGENAITAVDSVNATFRFYNREATAFDREATAINRDTNSLNHDIL